MGMFDFLGGGGGNGGGIGAANILTGVGMPGGPGGMGSPPLIPPMLMNQIQPGASPQAQQGGLGGMMGGDPRIMAMIQSLMSHR